MITLEDIHEMQPYELLYEELAGDFNISCTRQLSRWMYRPEQVEILLPLASGATGEDAELVEAARRKLKLLCHYVESISASEVDCRKPGGKKGRAFSYTSFTSLCPKHWGNPYWWDKGLQKLLIHVMDRSVPEALFREIQRKFHFLSPFPYLLGEACFHIKDKAMYVSEIQSDIMQHTAYIAAQPELRKFRNRLVLLYNDWPYVFIYECMRRAIAWKLDELHIVTAQRQVKINELMWGFKQGDSRINRLFERCYDRTAAAWSARPDRNGHYRMISLSSAEG